MTDQIMIYGATGYTGKLTARMAKDQGLTPILAGRNADKVKAVAEPLGFEYRAFGLDDPAAIDKGLEGIAVVLHIAGPFSATSAPMVDGCIRNGAHYLDITGEIAVFEGCAARDADAKAKGVMVLPGVGFDVVPSDCLAAHVAGKLPDATDLDLYIAGMGSASRGTMKTGVEMIGKGTMVRQGNQIVELPKAPTDARDFGDGETDWVGVSWGDVSTAWHSTKVPNIKVYFQAVGPMAMAGKMGPVSKFILRQKPVQNFLKGRIDAGPEGPTDEERASGGAILVGEAKNATGDTYRARLKTPDGYTLTYMAGLDIAKRAASGDFKAGFQTPSLAYGADFILGFDGCSREEMNI